MTQSSSIVLEAELYLQAVHTRTNQLCSEDQIRDLVGLAHSLIAARSTTAQTIWAKSDAVVNSLLQTSEHLQNEQAINASKKIQRDMSNTNLDSLVSPANVDMHAMVSNSASCPSFAQCSLEQYGAAGAAHVPNNKKDGQVGGGGGQEEIGDIEWEAMRAGDIKFEDVMGCSRAIDAIRESVVIPMQFPALFKRLKVKRSNGIMLYGPPGTGKSMIARATASEVDACFFNASCAELTSRWVGGSEKKLQSLFAAAVRNSPCIIFFDEVDSIACKREGDGSIADQRLTNQLLIELDKIFQAQTEVFVIAATNLPWQIDLAVMRRFPHTVYIELPNIESRQRMFRSFFNIEICSDDNIFELAKISEHMSGSDIANVVNSILFEPIRVLCRATHFVIDAAPKTPCHNSSELGQQPEYSDASKKTQDVQMTANHSNGPRIAVASEEQVTAFRLEKAHSIVPVGAQIRECSLAQLVSEFGEAGITMPLVEFNLICIKVREFRHTVSKEYLQQYDRFHDQQR